MSKQEGNDPELQQQLGAGDKPTAMPHPQGGKYVVMGFADPANPTDEELSAFLDALGVPSGGHDDDDNEEGDDEPKSDEQPRRG
jgi:hypothetical protein